MLVRDSQQWKLGSVRYRNAVAAQWENVCKQAGRWSALWDTATYKQEPKCKPDKNSETQTPPDPFPNKWVQVKQVSVYLAFQMKF